MTDQLLDDLSAAGNDVRACTDELRSRHEWSVILTANGYCLGMLMSRRSARPQAFFSRVSRYLQIPNGLDGRNTTAIAK